MEEVIDKVESKSGDAPEFSDIKKSKKSSAKASSTFKDVMSGKVLVRGYIVKHVPYIVLLVFLAILYITNRYKNEKIAIEEQQLQEEMKNLRSESITTAAELMRISRQSEVANLVKERGMKLEESTTPPKIIENK